MTNTQYDVAKRVLVMVVPAAITLISGFGALFKFDTEYIVGSITLVSTFLGVLLNAASNDYNADKPRIDPYEVDNEFTLPTDFPRKDDKNGK
ncbi:phage holin [Enterococcus sp. AZ194]|uniref:phage holin n=1 Tax=Enterococcus sp. AZ194 TaxID=2774629 RepID=UPI003F688B85